MLEFCGRDEYEYFYTFDKANTERLIASLTNDEMSIKDALPDRFGGINGCERLREYCRAKEIEFKFFSW